MILSSPEKEEQKRKIPQCYFLPLFLNQTKQKTDFARNKKKRKMKSYMSSTENQVYLKYKKGPCSHTPEYKLSLQAL